MGITIDKMGIFSHSMRELVKQAEKYHMDRSIPVLIEGETGTGKEVLAKMIHYGSNKVDQPFVDINCAVFAPSLFETELFGYEGGTFTGGLQKGQKGKIDLAQGGTIFLDEVSEIPLNLQVKLLRVLQEKEYYRVGGLKKLKLDARIICATNTKLEKLVKLGKFRSDLYFRLKVGSLVIPPLRERKEAIVPLAKMFLTYFSRLKSKSFTYIRDDTAKLLQDYHWPGNIRELKNVIEWIVFMYDDIVLKPQYLNIINQRKQEFQKPWEDKTCCDSITCLPEEEFPLEDHINNIICLALKRHRGNKTKTARYLRISRHALYTKLENIDKKNLQ